MARPVTLFSGQWTDLTFEHDPSTLRTGEIAGTRLPLERRRPASGTELGIQEHEVQTFGARHGGQCSAAMAALGRPVADEGSARRAAKGFGIHGRIL